MEGFRKKLARSGLFAALFFASFAIFASFHYHDKASGEVSSHHCAVCHNSSSSKVLSHEPSALAAPTLSSERLVSFEVSKVFVPAPSFGDPIRGPPLA